MEPTIFKYILRYSKRQQVLLLAVTLLSFPFLYYSLDLPKQIINQAIGGTDFPRQFLTWELDQIPYLFVLCGMFLVLVLINGGFKYFINVYKGQLGERMLRRLRYELFGRVLRFPLPHFRRVSQGEVISMINQEVEPLGGYIGDSFALPAFQGGTLLTIITFMFVQNPFLGLAAIALYPLQMYLIPKLQRRVNELGKERIRTVRKVSERIGEVVSGVQDVHANDAAERELADFSERMSRIYDIRYAIYRKKFFIKFLNNFIAQLTPFFFYALGGYLVITGQLTFGALVAALAAYKDLSAPWKELLKYYQIKEDVRIKYDQIYEQFHPADMLDEALQKPSADPAPMLEGAIVVSNIGLEEEGGIKELDGASFRAELDQHIALIGAGGSGRDALARVLARLLQPTSGSIRIGDLNLITAPESHIGRRIGYAGQHPHMFSGSVRDNLYYGIRHFPLRDVEYGDEARQDRDRFVSEAEKAGNTVSDLAADWLDYDGAGVDGPDQLYDRTIEVLNLVDLRDEIYQMGLNGTLDPDQRPDLTETILTARHNLRERLRDPKWSRLVEPFDAETYNVNMSVAENLLFGTPIGRVFDLDLLGQNEYVRSVLDKAGLYDTFLDTGERVATIMVELFQDLPPDHEYFQRYSFISSDELPDVQQLVRRIGTSGRDNLSEDDRNLLLSLPFKVIAGRHRLGVIDEALRERILEARRIFARDLPDDLRGAVAFFDADTYNGAASIQDNILFGKIVYGRREASQQVTALIHEVVDALGLERDLMAVGLETQVGVGGGRLNVSQAQKLAIARCIMKRPDLMIVNDAIAVLDPASQTRIAANLFREFKGRALIWVTNRVDNLGDFTHAIYLEGGRVTEHGTIAEMESPDGPLQALRAAN